MCIVCDKYKSGEIDGKIALKMLSEGLSKTKNVGNQRRLEKHLFELSEIILNNEVPFNKTDEERDRIWQENYTYITKEGKTK